MIPDRDLALEMYRRMVRIRRFDERAAKLHARGEIPGALHTSIGQEGAIVGACLAVRRDDYMLGTHRSHGHPIGKGASLNALMAELMGRVSGVNRGKGGSMHLADFSVGSLGETSIVASGVPVAAGAALAAKLQGSDQVCLCFFGDGATNEGVWHEGLNLSAVWGLPAIFLCENNLYSSGTYTPTVSSVEDIACRSVAYGIPGVVVDGQDVVAVYEAVSKAVLRARGGGGPSLIEAKTYRYDDHASNLPPGLVKPRPAEELEYWRGRDPIVIHRERLITASLTMPEEVAAIDAEADAAVDEAVDFARSSPYPDRSEIFEHLYSGATSASL